MPCDSLGVLRSLCGLLGTPPGARRGAHARAIGVAAFGLALGAGAGLARANDLLPLSDEFGDAASLSNWLRVHEVEQWNADQLEIYDIDATQPGRMVMMPYTVVWFQDWRGPFSFKEIADDFVVTIEVTATGRDGSSVPQALYSLGGVMIRTPRDITSATWTPGGENYVFLSLGHGNNGGTSWQFEVKTTVNSNSMLILSPAPGAAAELQLARLGEYVIALRREPGQPWVVHRRYQRSDFPATVQVGVVSYTDWFKAQVFAPFVHNGNVLDPPLPPGVTDPDPSRPFAPDLLATYDYVRFFRPTLPPELEGADLTDQSQVPDSDLLAFLGEHANVPNPVPALGTAASLTLFSLLAAAAALIFRTASRSTQ